MTMTGRLGTVLGLFVIAVGLIIWVLMGLLTPGTPEGVVNFVGTASAGQPVNLTLQTVGSIGYGNHPTWVTYDVKDPQGNWVHSTAWQLPSNTVIDVTIYQYDSGSPIRNQQWGQVTGTIGDVATLNGTTYNAYNSYGGNGIGHTFTVPALGIDVPLVGVAGNLTLCGVAPCSLKQPHNTITFSFKTPAKTGEYHWQCFVPCALGYLYGNGGPMSTQGFMGGFLDVVQQ
jgi:hypothetical protein